MDIAADLALFRAERDALAFLGLLSSLYLRFDPPIGGGDTAQPTHFQGLNIHALIIDNADGEVLALEHNQIHAHQSPVEHAEQRALRMAIARIGGKRPRAPATTVEDYYRTQMFYDAAPLFIRRSNRVRCARRLSWYAVSSGPYFCCKTQHTEEFGSAQRTSITKNTILNMGSSIFQMPALRSYRECETCIRPCPKKWNVFASTK